MDEVSIGVNLFVICIALALLEVHIEGPHGWATRLPTWRIDKPWIRKLTNGKPITGYHVYMNLVILAFLHYPLLWSAWTLQFELYTLSQFFIIAVWWDFLWFVTNPHFGIRRFKSRNIWWHDKWLLGVPKDYYAGTGVSVALWAMGDLAGIGAGFTLGTWAVLFGTVVGGTAATGLFVELSRLTRRAMDDRAAEKLVPEEIEDESPVRKGKPPGNSERLP